MQASTRSIILTALLMLFSSTAISGPHFTVGTENLEYLPFGTSIDGKATGFFKDILDEFGKTKGYTFTLKPTPVKRLMNNLISEQIDFKIPDNPMWASSLKTGKNITYSTPLTVYLDGVLVDPKNKGAGYEKLTSLVTVRGFTPFIFLDDIAKGSIKLQETSDLAAVVKMVSAGRAQGGFANITVTQRYMSDTLNTPNLLVHDDSIPSAKSDISLSTIKHPKVIKEFNAFLQSHAQWVADLKKEQNVP